MALSDDEKNALASGAQLAGYGAAIGAPIGGPVGAAVGAGIGFAGGIAAEALMGQGESEYETYRQDRINELKRRQEMGLLGLTAEEQANLQAQLVDPIRAQQRQSQLQIQGAMSGQGGQPAQMARFQIGQEQRIAEQMQPALTEIARADLAKARLEEQELQALLQEQDAQAAAEARMRQQQVVQGLGVGGMALSQYATAAGEAKAREQEMQALMQIIGGPDTGEIAGGVSPEALLLYQSIYGKSPVGDSGK